MYSLVMSQGYGNQCFCNSNLYQEYLLCYCLLYKNGICFDFHANRMYKRYYGRRYLRFHIVPHDAKQYKMLLYRML